MNEISDIITLFVTVDMLTTFRIPKRDRTPYVL